LREAESGDSVVAGSPADEVARSGRKPGSLWLSEADGVVEARAMEGERKKDLSPSMRRPVGVKSILRWLY
jgi:hypothetical protein